MATYTPLAQGAAPTFGTSGQAVKDLQTSLNTKYAGVSGYTPLAVDGKYGALTQAASQFKTPTGGTNTAVNQNGAPVTSPNNVNDPNSAHSYINGNQENDFNSASSNRGDTPPVKDSMQSYTDMFNNLKQSLQPSNDAPTAPKLVDTFNSLRKSQGVTDLETQLADLKSQQKAINDTLNLSKSAENGKPVAMNVIEGRQSEETRQANEKLAPINEQITQISDQLTQKYNVINSLMTYTSKDYETAKADYDKQFSDNIALMGAVKGFQDSQNVQADNARANLSIIYNNLNSGGADINSLSADEKANITKLETQAGLPVGFYASVVNKNPKSDILSTTTRDSNGTKYADVIMRNADGSMSIKSVPLGSVDKSNANGTVADDKNNAYSDINNILDNKTATTRAGIPVRSSDGKLTPEGFQAIVQYGATRGLTKSDILSQYGSELAGGGNNYAGYGLTPSEINKLTL